MEKRSSVLSAVLARPARWLMPVVALSMLGCPKQELAPLGPCTVSAVTERVDQSGVSDVDLLFVIDNSASMASEQRKLAAQLPRLVQVLTSGDRFAGLPDDEIPADDTNRMFTPVRTLHLGVVSTNMGGIDGVDSRQSAGVKSCEGFGDDGVMLNSVEIAVEGVIGQATDGVPPAEVGQEILPARPECAEYADGPLYLVYDAGKGDTRAEVAEAFSCVSTLGIRGCPFEQQLEAMWKALAPRAGGIADDESVFEFRGGSRGQGEGGDNDGFLREDAVLAVIIVSDEEDCSITDDGMLLFDTSKEAEAEQGPINLRCGNNATETSLIHSTDRYIEGLRSLKLANPDRFIYAAIVGVPEEAIADGLPIDDILDLEEMKFKPSIDDDAYPEVSCVSSAGDKAYPPRRMLEVAKGFPMQSVVYSICADDYSPALNTLIEKIASQLKGNCLPRRLNPGPDGKVNCEVFELLPKGETECKAEFGLSGKAIDRILPGEKEPRKACKMDQIAVNNATLGDGFGWYYDNFSEDLMKDCTGGDNQRISFRFENGNDLPSGAGATFECFQPVARIDPDATGLEAVNTSCAPPNEASCGEKSDDDYELICIAASRTCQIRCESNPDCPPGWVCDTANAGAATDDILFCQLPTCPQDVNAGGTNTDTNTDTTDDDDDEET